MNVGGGEAADQMVRMMLTSGEVAIRLTGSAMKNMLALSMALAKDHKRLSGKINMGKMLRETRDIRLFPMTPEQYKRFCKLAKRQKLLYSAIHDMDPKGDKLIDVVMPVTEIDRADLIFERILYRDPCRQPEQEEEKAPSRPQQARQEQAVSKETQDHPQKAEKIRVDEQEGQHQAGTPKKDFRSERDLPDTSGSSSTSSRSGNGTTSERPSVEARLKGYQEQLQKQRKSAPARQKTKTRPKEK